MSNAFVMAPGLASIIIPMLAAAQGGLGGSLLTGVQAGPAVVLSTSLDGTTWTTTPVPQLILTDNGYLRLTRDPAGTATQLGLLDAGAPDQALGAAQGAPWHSGFPLLDRYGNPYPVAADAIPPGDGQRTALITQLPAGITTATWVTHSAAGGDIDIRVYRWTGSAWSSVGSRGTASTEETLTLSSPAAGWYATEVTCYAADNGSLPTSPTVKLTAS